MHIQEESIKPFRVLTLSRMSDFESVFAATSALRAPGTYMAGSVIRSPKAPDMRTSLTACFPEASEKMSMFFPAREVAMHGRRRCGSAVAPTAGF